MAHRVTSSTMHLEDLVSGLVQKILAGDSGASLSPSATSTLELASEASRSELQSALPSALSLTAPLVESVLIAKADAAQPPPVADFVVNRATGTEHRAVVGPHAGVAASWIAACGWKYGLTVLAQPIAEADLPLDYRSLCKRCLPTWRARRQQTLADAAVP